MDQNGHDGRDKTQGKELLGHPVGLYILFFTEMWERFSYYGMRAILVLFLVSTTNGGLGWNDAEALSLYGWYTMLVYVMSIPGGIVADRYLGQKKSVMLGGFLLVAGHLLLAYTEMWAFYTALGLIILGVGFLKPNISTMVGGLYREGDNRRDSGFIIFYMGINIGAFLSSLIVGYVGETIGWHYGFALAGFGMLLGQLVFIYGQKYLKGVGNLVKEKDAAGKVTAKRPFTAVELDRIKLLFISFLIVLIFWAAFEQAGGFMNLFTKVYTDRLVAKEILVDEYRTAGKSAQDSISIARAQELIRNKSVLAVNSVGDFFNNLVSPTKKSVDELVQLMEEEGLDIQASTFQVNKAEVDSGLYAQVTLEEATIIATPDAYVIRDLNVGHPGFMVPASWFQSLNAMFIIIFGGIFAALWTYLGRKGKEPNTMVKFGLSAVVLSIGFLLMVFASMEKEMSELGKSSMLWLVGAYMFHTLGELCISPIALSFITKVAPQRIVASIMGIYWAVVGLGNFAAAKIGEQATVFGDKAVFAGITIFSMVFGLILIFFAKRLIKMTHGAEAVKPAELGKPDPIKGEILEN